MTKDKLVWLLAGKVGKPPSLGNTGGGGFYIICGSFIFYKSKKKAC